SNIENLNMIPLNVAYYKAKSIENVDECFVPCDADSARVSYNTLQKIGLSLQTDSFILSIVDQDNTVSFQRIRLNPLSGTIS
ncbi:MAG: hypothetical protein EZS28_008117, partial [Streblomastix strix]